MADAGSKRFREILGGGFTHAGKSSGGEGFSITGKIKTPTSEKTCGLESGHGGKETRTQNRKGSKGGNFSKSRQGQHVKQILAGQDKSGGV